MSKQIYFKQFSFNVTKSVSALLKVCPDRIWHGQRANYLATPTSSSLGDPDETCRPISDESLNRSGGYHTFRPSSFPPDPVYLEIKDRIPITH